MQLPSHRFGRIASVVTVALLPLTALASSSAGATSSVNVKVVGYSVVSPAYHALEAAFQATPAGRAVTFTNSFGASDTQTTNVGNGQPADLVNLSYGPNIATLVADHKVPANWATQELTYGHVNVSPTAVSYTH